LKKGMANTPNMVVAPYLVFIQDRLLVLGGEGRGYFG
jgi:hypothetical protein